MRTTAFVLLAALAVGCGKKSEGSNTGGGAAGIEGTYLLTGFEWGGDKMPVDELGKDEAERTVIITKDTIKFEGKKGGNGEPKQYKIDPSKSPAEIDSTSTDSKGKPQTAYGIYKLEGDTLTIVIGGPNKDGKTDPKDRPKEFQTKKDSLDIMLTMKKK